MKSITQINFKFPLGIGSLGAFEMNTNTKDAVKENVKLTILTARGERIINDVGAMYYFDVFKQTKDEIQTAIEEHTKEMFDKYFNFLKLDNVEVSTIDDNPAIEDNQVLAKIKYSFKGVEQFSDEVQIILS